MEFTLTYRGPLRANRGPKDKHALRCHFHRQLAVLWEQVPLNAYRDNLLKWPHDGPPRSISVIEQHHGFLFAPLVSSRAQFVATLDILLLRPEAPGNVLSQSGDLDNRVKTLLDALKMPHESNALPRGCVPGPGQEPFFCLLQDDALVTGMTVRTDRLLERVDDPAEVLLLARVRTTPVKSLIGTAGL